MREGQRPPAVTPARTPRPTRSPRSKYKGRFVRICGDTVRTSKNIGSFPSKNSAFRSTYIYFLHAPFAQILWQSVGSAHQAAFVHFDLLVLMFSPSHPSICPMFQTPLSQASIVKNGFPENRRATHCLLLPFAGARPLVPETNLCKRGTGTIPPG